MTLTSKDFFDLSSWAYTSGKQGVLDNGNLAPFAVAADHYQSTNDYDAFHEGTGFYGAAYIAGTGDDRQVLIGFQGTNLPIIRDYPAFAVAQILADLDLYYGRLPATLVDALTFTRSVIDTAEAQGISRDDIFLTGHSLGAAQAEYVAAQAGLDGVTFGTPGISTDFVPEGSVSGLTNYVEYGDPVGNYAYTAPVPVETFFLHSDKIQHYGAATYIGNELDAAPIVAAGLAFESTDDEVRAAALADMLAAAEEFHPLTDYRRDLPFAAESDVPDWMESYTAEDIERIVRGVLGDGNPLVDDAFYYAENPEVFDAHEDPEEHYARIGWKEGRDPNPFFSTNGYLTANPDVAASGANPLQHFAETGWKEGRDPGPDFDVEFYFSANPDVRQAGIDPLTHYLQTGKAEDRATFSAIGHSDAVRGGFDPQYYLLSNPDLARVAQRAGDDAFDYARDHFNRFGWREGRNPNALFDTKAYLATYADITEAGINPLQHYHRFGWKEGRDPSAEFDTSAYLDTYQDIAAGIEPIQHFFQFGLYEGRAAFLDVPAVGGSVG
ncbi:MAG TPA: hypothetical protein VHL31_02640 [Geminicoccus sp.]|jgi:hypothetical protein|uniref:hypothetical protein n=1 Tax=Geminicoccus sp. TaxID=2024832 RepID=UPI002E312AE0|nr:hypothetical protein [Geminicoccus sp.]HEX2525183.1 hypothetical protein [Geminicoccus sp.]